MASLHDLKPMNGWMQNQDTLPPGPQAKSHPIAGHSRGSEGQKTQKRVVNRPTSTDNDAPSPYGFLPLQLVHTLRHCLAPQNADGPSQRKTQQRSTAGQ